MQIVLLALLAVCVPISFCCYVYLTANDRVQLKQLHLAKETVGKVRRQRHRQSQCVERARGRCLCGGLGLEAREGACVRADRTRACARTARVCGEGVRSAGCGEFVGAGRKMGPQI